MKRRKTLNEATVAVLIVGLVLSGSISSGLAGRLPVNNQIEHHSSSQQVQATARQGDTGSLLTTVIDLALKYGPTLFNAVFGGSEQQTTDRIEEIDVKNEEPFSTSNLISMAIKVALALFSSATSGGIDKSDVSPVQSVLGIVISALTGSENPDEVSLMAKQATEVVNMLVSLVEALQTSFSSS